MEVVREGGQWGRPQVVPTRNLQDALDLPDGMRNTQKHDWHAPNLSKLCVASLVGAFTAHPCPHR